MTKAALAGGLFLFANVAFADTVPTFAVSQDYATFVLPKGTRQEIDRYNAWVSQPKLNPPSATEAYLDFGSRKVRVFLIGAFHDGPPDVTTIEHELAELQIDPRGRTLFIEQGDEESAGGGSFNLRTLIHARVPELDAAVDRASHVPTSVLNPDFSRRLVFATIARDWIARGGRFVNFDLADQYTDEALLFLQQHLEPNVAIRFLREDLFGVTFSWPEFETLLTKGFGFSSAGASDCCESSRDWVVWRLDDNQVRNLIRERYMRWVLAREMKDGDVVITHPVHLKNILAKERTDGTPP